LRRAGALGDPVDAWAEIVDDPQRARTYKRQRARAGSPATTAQNVVVVSPD
jgi:nitrate reductase alpha subunit